MFVVFDMDGTLSDPSHRVHFLTQEKKDWDSFYEACDGYAPKDEILNTMASMISSGNTVEIWTGRRESTRQKTQYWLLRYGIRGGYDLRMRKDGDHRHDTISKGEWLEEFGRPDLVFEDRNSMVEFYRSKGITCAQVALGDF